MGDIDNLNNSFHDLANNEIVYDPGALGDSVEVYRKVHWEEFSEENRIRPFQFNPGFHAEGPKEITAYDPITLFNTFFDGQYWDFIVGGGNPHLNQLGVQGQEYPQAHPNSGISRWGPPTKEELKVWFGVRMLAPIPPNNQLKSLQSPPNPIFIILSGQLGFRSFIEDKLQRLYKRS